MKKIIQEEMGDFDWIGDIPVFDINSDWVIETTDEDEYREIQEWLFSQDWWWSGFQGNSEPWGWGGDMQFFFNVPYEEYDESNTFDSAGIKYTDRYVHNNYVHYKWSNIRGQLIGGINESNDFEWAEKIEPSEEFKIGGIDDGVPESMATIGDRVSSYGDEFEGGTYEFTIEEVKRDAYNNKDTVTAVWGSDIPENHRYSGNDNNWHYVEYLGKV